MWEVEYTDEFEDWWGTLKQQEQNAISEGVKLLMAKGPALRFPYSSNVQKSRHGVLRELRSQ
jgi:hypothetical protein